MKLSGKKVIEKFKALLAIFKKGETPSETIYQQQDRYVVNHEFMEKAGWVSPQYTVSKSVTLDRQLLVNNRCVTAW
jgi:hypothetical protein